MKTLTLVIVFAFAASSAGAQWVHTNGSQGTSVSTIAIAGSRIFSGTDDGVFFSTNNGIRWTSVNNGLTDDGNRPGDYPSTIIAITGSTLFAGPRNISGVYIYTDDGSSWTPMNSGLPVYSGGWRPRVQCFTIDGSNVYAGTLNGVFFTSDKGSNWVSLNPDLEE